jgi:hypothetical protein
MTQAVLAAWQAVVQCGGIVCDALTPATWTAFATLSLLPGRERESVCVHVCVCCLWRHSMTVCISWLARFQAGGTRPLHAVLCMVSGRSDACFLMLFSFIDALLLTLHTAVHPASRASLDLSAIEPVKPPQHVPRRPIA